MTSGWFKQILDSEELDDLARRAREGGVHSIRGASGSSTSIIAAGLVKAMNRPVILVVAHLDDVDEIAAQTVGLGLEVIRFPALQVLPGETSAQPDLFLERLDALTNMREATRDCSIVIAPIQAIMQPIPDPVSVAGLRWTVRVGQTCDQATLIRWLTEGGYERIETIEEPGDFSVRGGIVDVFSPGQETPVRLDFFGDEIESIHEIDIGTMGSDRRLESAWLVAAGIEDAGRMMGDRLIAEELNDEWTVVLSELLEIREQARAYYERTTSAEGIASIDHVIRNLNEHAHALLEVSHLALSAAGEGVVTLPIEPLPMFDRSATEAIAELIALSGHGAVTVFAQTAGELDRFQELLRELETDIPENITLEAGYLHRGFIWSGTDDRGEAQSHHLVPYHELVHRYHVRHIAQRPARRTSTDAFTEIQRGDLVVHREHGIARFADFGFMQRGAESSDPDAEFLTLEFKGAARLYVPATDLHLIQRYVGAFQGSPQLSVLGGKSWKKQRAEVAEAVRDLAAEMLRVQAIRETRPGIRFPNDTKWQMEFEASFPYEETEDQLVAIASVKHDMTRDRPMDRLVCGDVGFGKTEVAIRAAFKAAEYGKQVAVLVPTTVLAEQHERTFRSRFADYPMRIESLSRFKTKKQQATILKEVRAGRVDIVIGTHRLLSGDVSFADLGLVIIDEEQRFGVEHKQRLLQLRMTADVLTLSATPIPRTLHMAMLGLRDISSLSTPPADRRAIVTEVIPYDEGRIRHAIERELAREGQVFFLHNRVYNIESVADSIQQLVPDARIVIGHGQMPGRQLERIMLQFLRRQADILVSTTIIESGIDIPTVNTMIINDANLFGLSELHQLRGRVGRYKHRAYCYLLLTPDRTMTETAVRRLRAIEEHSMLGAGFRIAMRDLEIRGAGNLIGSEQSGHIAVVGYEMYCELLQQATRELKNEPETQFKDRCTLDLGLAAHITGAYIPSEKRRLEVYRRLSLADSLEQVDQIEHDLISAYGSAPEVVDRLLDLTRIRVAASALEVRTITLRDRDLIFSTPNPAALETQMEGAVGSLRLVGEPDADGVATVYYRPPSAYLELPTLLTFLRRRLGEHSHSPGVTRAGS